MKDPQCAWDKRMGLPGGLEGVQAPVHGRDCSDSLHGACGWAVLPSCMPASRGHKLQQKIRAWSLSPPDHFFHFNRWASRGHSCHLFTSGQSGTQHSTGYLFSLMHHSVARTVHWKGETEVLCRPARRLYYFLLL